MSIASGRRGNPQAAHDNTLRTMQDAIDEAARGRKDADQATSDIAVRCGRLEEQKAALEKNNEDLRVGLRDADREIAALKKQQDTLIRWCLPMLIPGTFTGDPIPPDADVSPDPAVHDLRGSWRAVPGDRYDLPALIEVSS